MKNHTNIYFLALVYLSCSCQSKLPVEKSVVYEKFESCPCDTSINYTFRNECKLLISNRLVIKGLIGSILTKSDPLDRINNIKLDSNQFIVKDQKKFPKWPPSPLILNVCNLPRELSNPKSNVKVKVDLNIFYESVSIGIPKPQTTGGYPVELVRIELLDKIY